MYSHRLRLNERIGETSQGPPRNTEDKVRLPELQCPRCGSTRLYKDGLRYLTYAEPAQRWLCRKCGHRFSDPEQLEAARKTARMLERRLTKPIRSDKEKVTTCQICAEETAFGGAKNLDPEQSSIQVPEKREDIKGKLVQFAWWMEKQGYASGTIRSNSGALRALLTRNADLLDPESVKEALAREKNWSQNRRRNVINAYTLFLKTNGGAWEKPKCVTTRKFPFVPTEAEIDALIAGSGRTNATLTQLLKETAMRPGEAKRLEWMNIDSERCVISLNDPEKGSNARMWKVSQKLIGMLNSLPKKSEQIFQSSLKSMKTTFIKTRKRLAANLQNPRLRKITFYTFRHWKATTTYHKTKDILYVQQLLGHKDIRNTMVYINIEHTIFGAGADDEFTVRATEKPEEIKTLLETGFEYVCSKDSLIFLRKRK